MFRVDLEIPLSLGSLKVELRIELRLGLHHVSPSHPVGTLDNQTNTFSYQIDELQITEFVGLSSDSPNK